VLGQRVVAQTVAEQFEILKAQIDIRKRNPVRQPIPFVVINRDIHAG
jgi:hypothetical protein